MTPDQAEMLLRGLGLFHAKDVEEHFKIGSSMIGEEAMFDLADHLNGEFEYSEDYLLEKGGEDPYFSIIHSTKYTIFKEELLWLDKVLPENALIFDLGCNAGHMTALCAQMRVSCKFVGYDVIDLPLKKANQIKIDLGLKNLSFEKFDIMNLRTDPKPDGIVSLQALGGYLDDADNIKKVCNLADKKAFIILIEAFVKEKGLKRILKVFEEEGFSLMVFDKISCGSRRKIKMMPAILLARGFEDFPGIDIETISL